MNTDGTLVPPPTWTGASVGSACICVIPSYPRALRFHFLAPGAHRRPVWRRNAKLKKAVRTVPCVAGSSARHWLNDQSNQRVIGMPIENLSRLAVIPSVGNAEFADVQRELKYGCGRHETSGNAVVPLTTAGSANPSFSARSAPLGGLCVELASHPHAPAREIIPALINA
jgi:hypothetical protein